MWSLEGLTFSQFELLIGENYYPFFKIVFFIDNAFLLIPFFPLSYWLLIAFGNELPFYNLYEVSTQFLCTKACRRIHHKWWVWRELFLRIPQSITKYSHKRQTYLCHPYQVPLFQLQCTQPLGVEVRTRTGLKVRKYNKSIQKRSSKKY